MAHLYVMLTFGLVFNFMYKCEHRKPQHCGMFAKQLRLNSQNSTSA